MYYNYWAHNKLYVNREIFACSAMLLKYHMTGLAALQYHVAAMLMEYMNVLSQSMFFCNITAVFEQYCEIILQC